MKKWVCLMVLLCLCLSALAENVGEYLPLYQSPAAKRAGETVSMSMPVREAEPIAEVLKAMEDFSLGAGRTFLYWQQGMLIVEFTAQSAGESCLVSCRTQDETGNAVFEILLEQLSIGGEATLRALYSWEDQQWQLTLLP